MSLLQNSNAIEAGGYPISNSLRFQSASSQYLSRTPASAGNRQTWTWSGWVKFSVSSTTTQGIFGVGDSASGDLIQYNNTSHNVRWFINGATSGQLITTQVFRDPSAWYHLVFVFDTTNATSSDRMRIYVNGSRITSFSTASYPTQNYQGTVNTAAATFIGFNTSYNYLDGYMTEINFIDGQALTPSSFGETNTLTGQWVAKKYTGTYGTNGFYLPFSNGTSTTTLGADSSGNGNNWTLTNFTRSAGTSDCWMYDVPSGNGGVSGTQPNSNYAVMNPLNNSALTAWNIAAFRKANLDVGDAATNQNKIAVGTISMNSDKYYWEVTIGTGSPSTHTYLGIVAENTMSMSKATGVLYRSDGQKQINGTNSAYGSSYTAGDVLGFAYDGTTGSMTCYKNNVSQGVISSSLLGTNWLAFMANDNAGAGVTYYNSFNFGQRSFAYTPPSGFKALCTANLPASTIVKGNQYMDATTYTGTGANGRQVTNQGGFEPGMIWIKNRSSAVSHIWQDTTRGVGASNTLRSDTTGAESGQFVDAVNSTGYVVNGDTAVNGSGSSYVGWQWRTSSSTVTNTNGTISSQVRANPTSGVSVVTYTGTGANATVGHGLGVAPEFIVVKSRSASATNWNVLHVNAVGNTRAMFLNSTATFTTSSTYWQNTNPTSSVFSIGTDAGCNTNGATYVAYCFSSIKGFSAFPYYIGNGSADGTFLYLGFRPKFVMIKNTGTGDWVELDTSRDQYNVASANLLANSSAAETSSASVDILSNGIKIRTTSANYNTNGNYYAVIAFAESPFASSNAR